MNDQIEALLIEADPQGLVGLGAPDDEYANEARLIADAIEEAVESGTPPKGAEGLCDIIHQVFVDQFDSDIAGTSGTYFGVAERIWDELDLENVLI